MEILYGMANGGGFAAQCDDVCECRFAIKCDGEVKASLGSLYKTCDEYILTGIPAGGPYSLSFRRQRYFKAASMGRRYMVLAGSPIWKAPAA